jgi:hypothetical protein
VVQEPKRSTNKVEGSAPYTKAVSKPRGLGGSATVTPDAGGTNPTIEPFGPPPHLSLNNLWPTQSYFPVAQPQFIIMTPEMMSPFRHPLGIARPTQAPPSPTRSQFLLDEGPQLHDWIPIFDAQLQENEQVGPYLMALENAHLTRVRDLVRYTPKEIFDLTGCPIGVIGRACDYAHSMLNVPPRK